MGLLIKTADSSVEVPLPTAVEQLINKICAEKSVSQPDVSSKRLLVSIGEESAVKILNRIASSTNKIRTFSGYIIHMVKHSSAASSQSEIIGLSPQKRSLLSSSADNSPQKCARCCSPNSKKFEESPCSSSKAAKSRTITEYFPCSPNGSFGSFAPKQNISSPCSSTKDAHLNNIADSLNANGYISSVQKQLIFSPCSNMNSAIPTNVTLDFSSSPNASPHSSHVQEQLTKTCSSLEGANPSNVDQHLECSPKASWHVYPAERKLSLSLCSSWKSGNHSEVVQHLSDSPSAIHCASPIQMQPTLALCSGSKGASTYNIAQQFGSPTPSHSGSTSILAISEQSLLLKELEFRRSFMAHSYVGRKKLEDVISVDDAITIKSMKDLPMFDFEAKMWQKYGQHHCLASDRAMHLDWDSGKTHLYNCYVSADGSYCFKGPYLDTRRTHLQRELGDDNVLIVQFTDDSDMPANYTNWSAAVERILGGISVGVRHYRLFAFKDGRGDSKKWKMGTKKPQSSWAVKCYFVRKDSHTPWDERDTYNLFNKTSHEARCLFMHVHTVSSMSKYISRCSLALSNTVKLRVDLATVLVERIEDIPCCDQNGGIVCDQDGEPLLHTDGTGYISEDLAVLCAKHFYEGNGKKDNTCEFIDLVKFEEGSLGLKGKEACITEAPLLVQCRLFKEGYAVKGTLLVNKKLKARTIQIRPSMIKVEKDSRLSDTMSFNSLEINAISRKPRTAHLSKNLIALLSRGGVPKEYFLNLLESTLREAQKVSSNIRAAVRAASKYSYIDDAGTSLAMIGVGIPLEEPYLQYRLSIFANEERKGLRGGKLPVDESYYLIGTADPTGTLKSDEVCIILDNGHLSGKVLVYRNPGIHFGDIHVLNAKYVPEMEKYVGNAKYGIFFSTKGRRNVASEIANGDFDGDLYWVSKSPELLHYFKASEPWKKIQSTPSAPNKRPGDLSGEELERELVTLLFANKQQNLVAGKAADSWLAFMDRFLSLGDDADEKHRILEKMLKLVNLYYDALDAPKSGKKVELPDYLTAKQYPHFLEKKAKTYNSTSILGEIYDRALAYQPENSSTQGIWRLACFDIEIPEACLNLWRERYAMYRNEMGKALNSGDESKKSSADIVNKKYKQMLYEAEDFESSTKKIEDIYNEALAIYCACYEFAELKDDVAKCGFAWRVAGSALCSYYNMKTPGRSFTFKEDVLSKLI